MQCQPACSIRRTKIRLLTWHAGATSTESMSHDPRYLLHAGHTMGEFCDWLGQDDLIMEPL
jgi:hypothetical protein